MSERRIVRHARGRPTTRFEWIPGKRVKALDALVYATAAKAGLPLSAAALSSARAAAQTPANRVSVRQISDGQSRGEVQPMSDGHCGGTTGGVTA